MENKIVRKVKLADFLINSCMSCIKTFGANAKTLSYFEEQLDRLETLGQLTVAEKKVFCETLNSINMQSLSMMYMVTKSIIDKFNAMTSSKITEILKSYYDTGMIDILVLQFFGDFFEIDITDIEKNKRNLSEENIFSTSKVVNAKAEKRLTNTDIFFDDDNIEEITYNTLLNSRYYVLVKASDALIATMCSSQISFYYKKPKELDKTGIPENWEYCGLYEQRQNPNFDGCSGSKQYIYEKANVKLNKTGIEWLMRWKYTNARKPPVAVPEESELTKLLRQRQNAKREREEREKIRTSKARKDKCDYNDPCQTGGFNRPGSC